MAICSALVGGLPGGVYAEEEKQEPQTQQTQENAEDSSKNGEVKENSENTLVVVGMRQSLESAQSYKRDASTVKDVITASDIGALPDKSVTEALSRVPGVSIERFTSNDDPNHFSSEGTNVVVRGLTRVRSEINGRDSFSASAFGGGLSYADIPGELLGRIEVVKNNTAEMIAGGVAGTVNLVTRKPFDSDELIRSLTVKGSYGDHREEWTPIVTGVFSNVWDTNSGKFGVLLGVTDSTYKDRGDGVALEGYYERSLTADETIFFGTTGTAIPGLEDQTLYTPASLALRSANSDRERTGGAFSVQWQNPAETLEVTAEYFTSDSSTSWDERVVQYGEQGFSINPNTVVVSNGTYDNDGFMTAGTLVNNFMYVQTRWNETSNNIDDTSLHLEYEPTERLTLDFDYQKIKSTQSITDYTYSNAMGQTGASWYGDGRPDVPLQISTIEFDTAGQVPTLEFVDDTANPMWREQTFLRSAMDKETDVDAESDSFAFDLEYEIDDSWLTSVKTGVYISEKTQLSRDSDWNWGGISSQWSGGPGWTPNVLDNPELFEQYTYDAGEFHGGGVLQNDATFWFPRTSLVRNQAETARMLSGTIFDADSGLTLNPLGYTPLADRAGAIAGTSYLPSEISDTKENREEIYAQFNFEFNDLNTPIIGNFGLRYLSWQVESRGDVLFPASFAWNAAAGRNTGQETYDLFPNEYNFSNRAQDPGSHVTSVKGGKYTKVLPSLNVALEIADDHILRFAASENIYLPVFRNFRNYRNVVAGQVIDPNGEPPTGPGEGGSQVTAVLFSGTVGNPQIEPEESLNLDLSYEWYFDSAGSFVINLFRKEMDNLIRKRLFTESVTNPEGRNFDGDDVGPVSVNVDFQQDTNEGSGTISGFELAYTQFYDGLPGAWSGLGLSANYTFIAQSDVQDIKGFGDGSFGQGGRNTFRAFNNLDLPGYSDDTVNIALMYEKYDISARLAWNWRSEYLLSRRDADIFAPIVAKDTGQLDGSISYYINENFKVGFEATNLLDEVIETDVMYDQAGRTTPRSFFKQDRRFALFLQAKF